MRFCVAGRVWEGVRVLCCVVIFFFTATATPELYTLSLHAPLPILTPQHIRLRKRSLCPHERKRQARQAAAG